MTGPDRVCHSDVRAAVRALRPDVDEDDDTVAAAAARVAWSAVAEPGDATASALVAALGPVRSLAAVSDALDAGPGSIVATVLDHDTDAIAQDGDADVRRLVASIPGALDRWAPRLGRLDVGPLLAAAARVGASLVLPGDAAWSERLDDLGPHAPIVLWARGAETALDGLVAAPALAVVGSRANTIGGAEAAAEITSRAADTGCTVVSGGAYGIDAVAHRVAVAADAPTVALLAGGLDQLYPAGNVELLRSVMRHGMLLAESPPGTRPTRWRFLARNRLIAALADATVVVEAGARSGALNTAHHAAELGRPVLAVPGPMSSSASVGCHRLIASGRAQIVVGPSDPSDVVLAARAGVAVDTTPMLSGAAEDPEVLRVVDALPPRRAIGVDEIARRSGMSRAATVDALALAELQGMIVRAPDGWARAA